jgi:hypothetical protein
LASCGTGEPQGSRPSRRRRAGRDDRGHRRRRGNDQVDTAYRAKYGRYANIVDGITNAEARSTTLKLRPR